MGKKRVVRIPNSVKIKCPSCGKNNQIPFSKESVFKMECKKCKQEITTPIMHCCLICAYAKGKKCYTQLMLDVKRRGLEVKGELRQPEVQREEGNFMRFGKKFCF
jgi:ribosomal protein S27E